MPTTSTELRVGIVGSRRRATAFDRDVVFSIVEGLIKCARKLERKLVLVSGACKIGADAFAKEAADAFGVEIIEHPVDEGKLSAPGNHARRWEFTKLAHARNELIARDSHDALFALVSDDRTGGTENTIGHYRKLKGEGTGKLYLVGYDGKLL